MKNYLFAVIITVVALTACNGTKSKSTTEQKATGDMGALIEKANAKMKSGGVTNNFTCSASMEDDTLFVNFERSNTQPSESMNKIKEDAPAKDLMTKTILTYFYYVQFDENDFPYQALVNQVLKEGKYIGIKYSSVDGSWSNVISPSDMKSAINVNEEQRYEIANKVTDL